MTTKTALGPGSGPLALAVVTESDPQFGHVTFKTGQPVTLTFIRNTEKSPYFGAQFGQDVEPAGRYMLHEEDTGSHAPSRGWQRGTVTFKNPLVLRDTTDAQLYGPNGWKARIWREMGGNKKGAALSKALQALGHDAIVTVTTVRGRKSTSEIIELLK